jgi:small GTP-binding protein
MSNKKYDFTIKLLLIGDSNVGKTSILTKYVDNNFTNNYNTTIGIDFKIKTIIIGEYKVKLQLWDTAGQEKFRALTTSYFRGAQGVIITFDLTKLESFLHTEMWLSELLKNNDDYNIILVGNKSDLKEKIVITKEQAETFAKKNNLKYFECSASTGENLNELFQYISSEVCEKIVFNIKKESDNIKKESNIKLNQDNIDKKGKKCC